MATSDEKPPRPEQGDVEMLPAARTDSNKQGAAGQAPAPLLASVPFSRLLSTADKTDWLLMCVGTLGAMGTGAGWPIFAILFGEFTDTFGEDAGSSNFLGDVKKISLSFLYLSLGCLVSGYLMAAAWMAAGHRQANRLRRRYLQAVLLQEVAYFDTQATTGKLLKGLNEDSSMIQAAISEKAASFIQHMTTFVMGWAIAFAYGWDMALVLVGCLPFLAGVGALMSKMSTNMTLRSEQAYTSASSVAQQAISQIRTVVAYCGEQRLIADYKLHLDGPAKVGAQQAAINGLSLGSINAMVYFTYAAAFAYGAWRVSIDKYTGGQVLQVLVAALLGGFALGQATPSLETFAKGRAAGANMFAVIDRQPVIVVSDEGEKPKEVHGDIELRNVAFAYPARPDVLVFRSFNLTIPAGKTLALVGSSGSGKSTVVALLERYYDPAAGQVLLDGRDLRTLSLKWLRNQVGLVSQEPTLFATTIFENIVMGRPGSSPEEVEAAARAANAHDFIRRLPEGYNTKVGERGVAMSGGQKQRIAIARAILKDPKILLLDEATSALDAQSEKLVQEALDRMTAGRTTVVVAHRLSTVCGADVIVVVKAGEVVEQGTHEALLQNPVGTYSALVKLQMQEAAPLDAEEEEWLEGVEEGDEEAAGQDGADHGARLVDEDASAQLPQQQQGSRRGSHLLSGGAGSAEHSAPHSGPLGGAAAGSPPAPSMLAALKQRLTNRTSAEHTGNFLRPSNTAEHTGRVSADHPGGALHSGSGPNTMDHAHSDGTNGAVAAEVALQVEQAKPAPKKKLKRGASGKGGKGGKGKGAADDDEEDAAVDVPLKRLLTYNQDEWQYMLVGSAASIANGVVQPAFAFVISSMITVLYDTDKSDIQSQASVWSWVFFGIGCGTMIVTTIQQYCFGVIGHNMARTLRVQLLKAMLRQEIGWFDLEKHSSGVLVSRLAEDAAQVRGAVGDTLALMLQNIACLAIGYLIAFAYMWRMALVVTGALPFMLAGAVIYYKTITGFETGSNKLYGAANQAASDAFSSVRVVHAYNLHDAVGALYSASLAAANHTVVKRCHLTGVLLAYSSFSTYAIYSLILYFGGAMVDQGINSFEDMLKSFLAILMAAMGIAQAQVGFPAIGKAKAAIRHVFPIIDRVPKIDSSSGEGMAPPEDSVRGEIQMVDVKFVYPARPSVVVFRRFNLTIPAGQTVALVGESGSGKSTVVGLLERFYDPLEGHVLLDGVDLRQYNLRWLRQQIGLVSQEPLLFSTSVLDNIRYGSPDASMEAVVAAAKAANVHDLIEGMPDKYDTQVGERGVQLSGGQKQRIAIARAVVKNPKILLLDEATSALDAQSEKLVQDALDGIMVGRTSVVVAHRLSTIRHAHCIALVFRGQVLETGTHDELMAANGGYAKLVEAQMGSKSMMRSNTGSKSMTRIASMTGGGRPGSVSAGGRGGSMVGRSASGSKANPARTDSTASSPRRVDSVISGVHTADVDTEGGAAAGGNASSPLPPRDSEQQ